MSKASRFIAKLNSSGQNEERGKIDKFMEDFDSNQMSELMKASAKRMEAFDNDDDDSAPNAADDDSKEMGEKAKKSMMSAARNLSDFKEKSSK